MSNSEEVNGESEDTLKEVVREIEVIQSFEDITRNFELNDFDWDPGAVGGDESDDKHSSSESTSAGFHLDQASSQLAELNMDECASYRIQALEDEQESLLSSLMALTTHFAQVQFRLHQISEAPEEERVQLLKKLEDFADRPIPNWAEKSTELLDSCNIMNKLDSQRNRQQELIEQLKNQLEDLEKYAYETGEPVLPQSMLMEKQRVIINELKTKMNFTFNEVDLPQLTSDELRSQIDVAFGEFVSPLKMKEQLVAQLKTQVNDLERFIKFLQGEKYQKKMLLKLKQLQQNGDKKQAQLDLELHNSTCDCNSPNEPISMGFPEFSAGKSGSSSKSALKVEPMRAGVAAGSINGEEEEIPTGRFLSMIQKASTMLQIFAWSQIGLGGCGSQNGLNKFKKNVLKKTYRGNHWGDIRARLEVDIQDLLALSKEWNQLNNASKKRRRMKSKRDSDDSDDEKLFNDDYKSVNIELITLVRKKFAMTLQSLIQHGLHAYNNTKLIVPFIACFANFQMSSENEEDDFREIHAWELILEYYQMKNGDFYNETPAMKLSQSYNLNIAGDNVVSNKQSLLFTIRNIMAMHGPYKRSQNSHFKAFVCAALNSHKLVQWLNLIFQCHDLINTYYASWSYVANTGFRDALKSLDQLTKYDFDLPVDLAIRQFQNIKDAFL